MDSRQRKDDVKGYREKIDHHLHTKKRDLEPILPSGPADTLNLNFQPPELRQYFLSFTSPPRLWHSAFVTAA